MMLVSFWDVGVTSLDVHDLALRYLSCDSSPLEELILGDPSCLRTLSCYGTAMTEVDISGYPLLIEAYHGSFIADATSDCYEAEPYTLYVNPGAAVITGIPAAAFRLPDNLRVLEDEAFAGIPAQAVIIPPAVTEIEGDPFANSSVQWIYGLRGTAAEAYVLEHPGMTFVPVTAEWLVR